MINSKKDINIMFLNNIIKTIGITGLIELLASRCWVDEKNHTPDEIALFEINWNNVLEDAIHVLEDLEKGTYKKAVNELDAYSKEKGLSASEHLLNLMFTQNRLDMASLTKRIS